MIRRNLALALGTRRGLALLIRNVLALFGLLSGAVQLGAALWPQALIGSSWLLLPLVLAALVFGLVRALPRRRTYRDFGQPDIRVTVKVGDLFDQQTHMVIGSNDVFDTDTTDGIVISPRSVQGQFLDRMYGGDRIRLDADLNSALRGKDSVATEPRKAKPRGKLRRYPIGTVAVLGAPGQLFFFAAYTKLSNDLISKSDVDLLWQSLGEIWQAVYLHGQRRPVSMAIVGSELARINCLDRESLLKMILLSFVARSRQELVCKELIVVIHPNDYHHINMLEVAAFLRTL